MLQHMVNSSINKSKLVRKINENLKKNNFEQWQNYMNQYPLMQANQNAKKMKHNELRNKVK